MSRQCRICEKVAHAVCGKCQTAQYCSRDCQRQDWIKHKLQCIGNDTLVMPPSTQQGPSMFAKSPTKDNAKQVFERQLKWLAKKTDEATAKLKKPHLPSQEEEIYTKLYNDAYEATKTILIAYGATKIQLATLQQNLMEMRSIVYNLQMGMLEDKHVKAGSFERYAELDRTSRELMNKICGIREASPEAQQAYENEVFDSMTSEFIQEAADAYVDSLDAMRAAKEAGQPLDTIDDSLDTIVKLMDADTTGFKDTVKVGIEGNKQFWFRSFLRCQGYEKFLKSDWLQRQSVAKLKEEYEIYNAALRLDAEKEGYFSNEAWATWCLEQLEESEQKVATILENKGLSEKDHASYVERQSWFCRIVAHLLVAGGIYGLNALTATKPYTKTVSEYQAEHKNLTAYVEVLKNERTLARNHMEHVQHVLTDTRNYLDGNQTELNYALLRDRLLLRNPSEHWIPILEEYAATNTLPTPLEPYRGFMSEMLKVNGIAAKMESDLNNPNATLSEGTASFAFLNPIGNSVIVHGSDDVSTIPRELQSASTRLMEICTKKAHELLETRIAKRIARGNPMARNLQNDWLTMDAEENDLIIDKLQTQMSVAWNEGRLTNDAGIQAEFNNLVEMIDVKKGGSLSQYVVEEYSKRLDPDVKSYTEAIAALKLIATQKAAELTASTDEWRKKDLLVSQAHDALNILTSEAIRGPNIPQSVFSRFTHIPSDILYLFQDLVRTLRSKATGSQEPAVERFKGYFLPVAEAESKLFSRSMEELRKKMGESTYDWNSIYGSAANIAAASVSFALIGGWAVTASVAVGIGVTGLFLAAKRKFYDTQSLDDEKLVDKVRPYQAITLAEAMKSSGMRQVVKGSRSFASYVAEAVGHVTVVLNSVMLFGQCFYGMLWVFGYVEPADIISTLTGIPWVGTVLATATRPVAYIINGFFQIALTTVTFRTALPEHMTGGLTCWDILIKSLATLGPILGGSFMPGLRTPLSSTILAGLAGTVWIYQFLTNPRKTGFGELSNLWHYNYRAISYLLSGAVSYGMRFVSPSLKKAAITAPEERSELRQGVRRHRAPPPPRLGRPPARNAPRDSSLDELVTPVPLMVVEEKRGRSRVIEPQGQPEKKKERTRSKSKGTGAPPRRSRRLLKKE
jgi:hypothetical protein